ncbi:zf-HC2 domain-containing protein [Streptomyces sp. IpFD-1.1]|nr:zf-HC2 domain-containing protein [Streptomyces sp. IpFD-1.1]MCO6748345.1 zf-HC2 domain-containing protein [Streptomyces sp. IpFD-1.1]
MTAHRHHLDAAAATRYASGELPEPASWQVERHLEGCGACAARVSAAARATAAGPTLAAVRSAVLAEVAGLAPTPEAPPAPVRAPSRLARLRWAAGPALRGPWPPAVAGVCLVALVLAHGGAFPQARTALLLLAPLLPLAGVALSYGPHTDPLHELTATTPGGGLRLLLVRGAAVLAVCVPALTAAGALLPEGAGGPGPAAWLLPALALTLGALALGSYLGCRNAVAVVGGLWSLGVLAPVTVRYGALPAELLAQALTPWFSSPAAQAGWAGAAVCCAALLAVRRHSFDSYDRPEFP